MRFVQFILLIGLFAFSFAIKDKKEKKGKKDKVDPCACEKIGDDDTKEFCQALQEQKILESIKNAIFGDLSGNNAINECNKQTRSGDLFNCQNLVTFLINCKNPIKKKK